MPFPISREVVKEILYGVAKTRFTQDSGVMPEVWITYAANPGKKQDLILTPFKELRAAELLKKLSVVMDGDLAYLEGRAVVRLSFKELIQLVLPMSSWWQKVSKDPIDSSILPSITRILKPKGHPVNIDSKARIVLLIGLIQYASISSKTKELHSLSELRISAEELLSSSVQLLDLEDQEDQTPLVWMVTCNRKVEMALETSVPCIKGDAVSRLFQVSCSEIAWAIIDSGIDTQHPAFCFKDTKGNDIPRVRAVYDFTEFRHLISQCISSTPKSKTQFIKTWARKCTLEDKVMRKLMDEFAHDYDSGRAINWALIEPLIYRPRPDVPTNPHGTHVAGIMGADWDNGLRGVCPDIRLYDFRVLSDTLENTEFALMAALQFIRYLNDRNDYTTIHGANISLSIPHDVSNFACGRTPVCQECIRLVSNGVVVVVAAGNHGYHEFQTQNGIFKGYSAFSITDPGNTEEVITVGSTHRLEPHTYGISYFSSRGPTGDGRSKPDLVAPGEKIRAPFPGGEEGVLDGTSMAAPHVSGVAALLLARYSELIGKPARIKEILCSTATDLGRERHFQGAGLVDALRAMQSI